MIRNLVSTQGSIRYKEVFKISFLVMPFVALYSLIGESEIQFEVLHAFLYGLLTAIVSAHVVISMMIQMHQAIRQFRKKMQLLISLFAKRPDSMAKQERIVLADSYQIVFDIPLSYGVIRC